MFNMLNTNFRIIKEAIRTDDRGRITIGNEAKGKTYQVLVNDLGQILLEPVITIPERERWLFENPEALASVKQGLKESAEGKAKYLGSFAQYADLEIDDE